MAYGMKKIAKLNPANQYKEWGTYTGYFASAPDA
jgi:hypothetical protein